MAVFFKNDCTYTGCTKTFSSLSDLIEHIESVHIDFDNVILTGFNEKRLHSVPLSCILKHSDCQHSRTTENVQNQLEPLQKNHENLKRYHNIGECNMIMPSIQIEIKYITNLVLGAIQIATITYFIIFFESKTTTI